MKNDHGAPDISVILVNYRSRGLTQQCIQSILASNPKLCCEIIVVDNDSEDGSLEWLKEQNQQNQQVCILDSGRNGGFACGNNTGIRAARGKYLLLLNNDTEIRKGMPEALFEFAENNPEVGILGCRAADRSGNELPVVHRYEDIRRILLQIYVKPWLERIGLQRKAVRMADSHPGTDFIRAQWITGSAMFIRRELYYQLGGLDENYFMYMEDEDLCHRMNDAGYIVGMIPWAEYVHDCGGSTHPSCFLTKEYIKSRLIYFSRYQPRHFRTIRKLLYRQIRAYHPGISRTEEKQMKKELDAFIGQELPDAVSKIRGI